MNLRTYFGASALLLSISAFGGTALSTIHPEEAIPDNLTPMASPGPHAELIKQVQEKLHEYGFDAGPVNGDFGTKTQAALAQYQLAMTLPASGMLDKATLRALGVQPAAAEPSEVAAAPQDRPLAGSCDALTAPEKERCLQQGGTVEASMKSSSAGGSKSGDQPGARAAPGR